MKMLNDNFNKGLNISKKILKRSRIQLDEIIDFNLKYKTKFRFSIILIIDCHNKNFKTSIDSIINQNIGFENNIQLTLIDTSNDYKVKNICLKYTQDFPNNVLYFNKENISKSTAKNLGIKNSKGKYINFLNAGDKLDLNSLNKINDFFKKYYYDVDIVSIPIKTSSNEINEDMINDKFDAIRIIDLNKEPNYMQYSISSTFFKMETLIKFTFENEAGCLDDSLIFNKILLEKNKLGIINDTFCFCENLGKITPNFNQKINNKNYYEQLNYFSENLFNYSNYKLGSTPYFIKYDILYFIMKIFEEVDNPHKLTNNILNLSKTMLYELIQKIDDEIIIKQRNVDKSLKYSMLLFKHGENTPQIYEEEDNVVKKINDIPIDNLDYHKIYIDYIEVHKNKLYLGGFFKSFFDFKEIKIQIVKFYESESLVYDAKYVDYPYRDRTYLDLQYDASLNFEFEIPLFSKENSILKIQILSGDSIHYLDLFFNGYAKLSKESFYSKKGNYLIIYEENSFKIINYELNTLLKLEQNNIDYLKQKEDSIIEQVVKFRKKYNDSYKQYQNRKIWLFMDRIDSADDNAEHLYKYAIKQNDDIEKYFVISNKSKDYNRLKEIGKTIDYGSEEHMLLSCFAEKIICSHPDDEFVNPFYHKTEKYYNGLFSAKICFLQHGIILNNISSWLHKYDKFLYLIVTTSQKEYSSFFNYPYNYDESVVQLLGLPRFDNLNNDNKKNQILIMPTWRRFIENLDENQIKNSKYYKKLNSLLNNPDLIKFLKDSGYAVIFKPHPNLNEYVHLFDFNEYVKLDVDTSYQTMLNESKLLITDFSSVTFDFAYLKKPILYYQYDMEEFHFDLSESYFDFDKMGFGEVVHDENSLIQLIKSYISNDCAMKKEFINRANDFYEFNDKNNCKRVYEKILEIDEN